MVEVRWHREQDDAVIPDLLLGVRDDRIDPGGPAKPVLVAGPGCSTRGFAEPGRRVIESQLRRAPRQPTHQARNLPRRTRQRRQRHYPRQSGPRIGFFAAPIVADEWDYARQLRADSATPGTPPPAGMRSLVTCVPWATPMSSSSGRDSPVSPSGEPHRCLPRSRRLPHPICHRHCGRLHRPRA